MSRRPNPLEVLAAKRRFEDFTGAKPTRAYTADLDDRDRVGYRLGEMVGVAYEATRDGKKDQYFHRFKKQARPDLVVRSDGKQLYTIGGDYHVTERGIEDMPSMFVVNPSPRKRSKRRKASRGRTSTGQFTKNPTRKRKAAPMARAKTRRRKTRRTYARNPIRRVARTMRRNPTRRRRSRRIATRSFRRNPIRLSGGGKGKINIGGMLMPAAMVGLGAVGAEMLMGVLPLPAMLTTGPQRYLTKGAISVGAGYLLARFGNRKAGEALAMGGLVIAFHDAIKSVITSRMPNAKFGGYNWDKYGYNLPTQRGYASPGLGYYSPGSTLNAGMGEYVGAGMGEYVGDV